MKQVSNMHQAGITPSPQFAESCMSCNHWKMSDKHGSVGSVFYCDYFKTHTRASHSCREWERCEGFSTEINSRRTSKPECFLVKESYTRKFDNGGEYAGANSYIWCMDTAVDTKGQNEEREVPEAGELNASSETAEATLGGAPSSYQANL